MQDYTYSVFSIAAIAIHLIINFGLLTGRGSMTTHSTRYRGFLLGILAYYIADAGWGILAGLGWTKALYVETVFFFLSIAVFVFMWANFIVAYLEFGKRTTRILYLVGGAILLFNLAALAVNPFTGCVYSIDAEGVYHTGCVRDPAFYLLIAYNVLMGVFILAKAVGSQDSARRRCTMALLCCTTMAAALVLQIIWPLTPFTSLGCLINNCFLHVFVIQDEQTARHLAKLENALERARAAEKARSMFFSIVSHDIRTPLNAILGYSELLQYGIKDQNERDEALKSIRSSGATLLELVNDVLDLAKMDSGKMTFHPAPVRLSRLTDEVFSSFRLAAKEKGIELVDRTTEVPTVLLDEHRFRQILFNLVGNAVKFTEHGSITVAASYSGTTLEVSVADTGCGIAPDMLTRILDPFVQVQDPSHAADRASGTGLGLSICRSLVKTMGGELLVESELGKGSRFSAVIPNVAVGEEEDVEEKPAAGPKAPAAAKKLPKRVLVVDDSPVNRAVLTAFLKRAGIVSIGHANDGAEALATLDSAIRAGRPYDFVLSDLWMPNMNGVEFVEKLRADARFDRLPCFALTADTEFRRDARTELFTGILLKPMTYAKLVEALASTA